MYMVHHKSASVTAYLTPLLASHGRPVIAGRLWLLFQLLLTQFLLMGAVMLAYQRIKRLTLLLKLSTCSRKVLT